MYAEVLASTITTPVKISSGGLMIAAADGDSNIPVKVINTGSNPVQVIGAAGNPLGVVLKNNAGSSVGVAGNPVIVKDDV